MNLIFITLSNINDVRHRGIYADLMRKFRDEEHDVYIVSPCERRFEPHTEITESTEKLRDEKPHTDSTDHTDSYIGRYAQNYNKNDIKKYTDSTDKKSWLMEVDGVKILKVRTLNIQKTNVVEKGIGTLMIESQFKKAIKKYLGDVQFDLILYSTPPITFTNVVKFLKKRNPKAISYLLLKDIFPQNAVDIGMFGEHSLFNWWFRRKEIALYKASDYIGCMSPANVEFIRKHNTFYPADRVEVAPNSISLTPSPSPNGEGSSNTQDEEKARCENEKVYILRKYGLPLFTPIFIYGGNLGKPQGIDYLIKCLDANKHRKDCFFVVVGNGTEYSKLKAWYDNLEFDLDLNHDLNNLDLNLNQKDNGNDYEKVNVKVNVKLMERLPKEDYDMLVKYCDVGLIFLDHRFTIPNYPSRLLPYLENKRPIICATDVNTDIGRIAEENGYGFWCESVKPEDFTALVNKMLLADRKTMGERGYEFLCKNYTVQNTYDAIMKHLRL